MLKTAVCILQECGEGCSISRHKAASESPSNMFCNPSLVLAPHFFKTSYCKQQSLGAIYSYCGSFRLNCTHSTDIYWIPAVFWTWCAIWATHWGSRRVFGSCLKLLWTLMNEAEVKVVMIWQSRARDSGLEWGIQEVIRAGRNQMRAWV